MITSLFTETHPKYGGIPHESESCSYLQQELTKN